MMDTRYGLLMLGYPSTTTNTSINYGIYSWGAVELTYPNSFGYSYTLANAMQNTTSATNLKIGTVRNFVDTMYMSWQYTDANSVTHYGLDVTDNTSTPAPVFNWLSLIWDGGARYKVKRAYRLRINFLPLPAGVTLNAQYILDRGSVVSADPVSGTPYTASTGDTAITVEIGGTRFMEAQWGFFGTNSAGVTSPVTVTGVTMEIDTRAVELDIYNDPNG
jgi:hypothetical protein